jgi:hypothetical protein
MKTPEVENDICANFHGGAAESGEANSVIALSKGVLRQRILNLLIASPLHCEAVEELLGMKHQTASARLSELLRDGRVTVCGRTKTRSGSSARVYRIVDSSSDAAPAN